MSRSDTHPGEWYIFPRFPRGPTKNGGAAHSRSTSNRARASLRERPTCPACAAVAWTVSSAAL